MKMSQWVVPAFVVLGVTLCLGALNGPKYGPEEADTSLPPDVGEKDWHALSEDFGFILRVTKEPRLFSRSIDDENSELSNTTKEEMRKLLADREKKLQELREENATKEQTDESLKDFDDELKRLLTVRASGLQKVHYYGVGEAQAQFYARKDKKWYKVATPPPPVGFHLLQK